MINYLTLIVAFALSIIAGYFSIVGLATIFSAAFWSVVILGTVLEAAKVVSVSWLYRHWKVCPKIVKGYLISAIIILMFITSMGTFGYLSKAHIEQTTATGDNSIELQLVEDQIDSERKRIENAQISLNIIDRLITDSTAKRGIQARKQFTQERKELVNEIADANNNIKMLSAKAMPLRKESLKLESEVGPIKYISDFFVGESSEGDLERAVRWVIVLIVVVFDPLAIILFLSANIGFAKMRSRTKPPTIPVDKIKSWTKRKKDGIIEIDSDSVMNIR